MSRPRSTTTPVDELGAILADLKARMTRVEQQSHLHPASGPGGLVPVGTVFAFGGAAAPTGYLLASGGTQLIATYPDLWGVFGTTYGGNGTTTFGIPDLRGRVIAGVDNMGGVAANRLTATTMTPNGTTRGATGGAQTNTHNHYQSVGYDGGSLYAKVYNQQPRSQVINVYRAAYAAGFALALGRFDSTDDETIDKVQPTLLLNYIIKT